MSADSRVVIITGAASGIGLATAHAFAQSGDRVVIADQDAIAAATAAEGLRKAGAETLAIEVDVSDRGSVDRMVRSTTEWFGTIDVLVNNAAIGIVGDLLETDAAGLERTLAVNVVGVFNCCQAVLPAMLKVGGGIIVNVASAVAIAAVERRAAYTASKGAVVALTRSIAVDFMRRGIRCNAVAPGTVDSPWVGRIIADQADPVATRQAMTDRQPLGRLGRPEEIASAIRYLASSDASFAHGACLVIDGGFSAR